MRFDDKIVAVTGAASGIGLETVRAFAAEGARVVGIDRDADGAKRAEASLGELASRVDFEIFDLSTAEGCQRAIAAVVERGARLDILCNVAGFSELVHFTDVSEEQFYRMVSVNLGGVFFTTQAAMPHLVESHGNVVSVASVAGLTGNPYNSSYCATKGAVVNLTRALAVEYSQRGVRVNCVCPGSVLTDATKNTFVPDGTDPDLFRVMMPPLGNCEPADIAEAILYLASDVAQYVTGTALAIDGGRTAL
ncbi:MAG: SDR family oxidoreductase [Myxococcota bacterium]|nr:SDR family oxidoreductase [Myxococcota bacterium]